MLSVEALFLQASNFNYYGSKEEGEESRQEGSKEEEGINPFLPQNKNSPSGSFCFSGLSYLGHNLIFGVNFCFFENKRLGDVRSSTPPNLLFPAKIKTSSQKSGC